MPVTQVGEYWISIDFGKPLSDDLKDKIEELIRKSCTTFTDYSFSDDNTYLVVDGLGSESDGLELEEQIQELINIEEYLSVRAWRKPTYDKY